MFDLTYCITIYICFFLLIILSIRISPDIAYNKALDRFNALRGLFAIEIIIGHSIQPYETMLSPFKHFMCLSVAFFFFISAYGMTRSFKTKPNYLKGFLAKKSSYLLGINTISFIFGVCLTLLFRIPSSYWNNEFNLFQNYYFSTNWYVWELLAFYCIFFILYKLVNKRRVTCLFLLALITAIILYYSGVVEMYYTAIFAFPLGALFGEYDNSWSVKTKKVIIPLLAISFAFLGLLCFIIPAGNVIRDVFLRNCMGIGLILGLFSLFLIIEIKSKILHILCTISTEMYIFQFIFLDFSQSLQMDYKHRLAFVIICTITIALLLHIPISRFKKLLTRSHSKETIQ